MESLLISSFSEKKNLFFLLLMANTEKRKKIKARMKIKGANSFQLVFLFVLIPSVWHEATCGSLRMVNEVG